MSAVRQTDPQPVLVTPEDYLAFERASDLKHEYYGGQIIAMSGASEAHNLICVNLTTLLKNQLRGRPCKVYPSDLRVMVEAFSRLYVYPDVSIVCGEAQLTGTPADTLLTPTVIIEVLSPSTEQRDRGIKFQYYRELPSLQAYLLVAQERPHVERYLRQQDMSWQLVDARGLDARLALPPIDAVLPLAEVYEQVIFPAG